MRQNQELFCIDAIDDCFGDLLRELDIPVPDWGTARSVDAMMSAYPNVERRHIVPADFGVEKLGHMGYFRAKSRAVWEEALAWLEMTC